jgi:hypothetical protein
MKPLSLNTTELSLSEVKKLKANAASEQEHRRFFAIELLLRGEDRENGRPHP